MSLQGTKNGLPAIAIFIYLTEETVQAEYLRTIQLQIDFLFEKRLFRSLSPMEVQRLHMVDPIAKKKMLVDYD